MSPRYKFLVTTTQLRAFFFFLLRPFLLPPSSSAKCKIASTDDCNIFFSRVGMGHVCVTTCTCLTSHRATSSLSTRSRPVRPCSTTARHPRDTKLTTWAADRVSVCYKSSRPCALKQGSITRTTSSAAGACFSYLCVETPVDLIHFQARRRPRFDGGPQCRRERARVPCKAGSEDYVPRPVELADKEPDWIRLGLI